MAILDISEHTQLKFNALALGIFSVNNSQQKLSLSIYN